LKPDLLAAARDIQDEVARAEALGGVAGSLPEALKPDLLAAVRDLLVAVCTIQDEGARSEAALIDVAQYLSEALARDMLAAARAIHAEEIRAKALGEMAPFLPDLQPELLAAAREIHAEGIRVWLLRKVTQEPARKPALAKRAAPPESDLAAWAAEQKKRSRYDPGLYIEAFVHVDILERQDPILEIPPSPLEVWEGLVADCSYEVRIDLSGQRDPRQKGGSEKAALYKAAEEVIELRVAVATNSPNLRFINQVSRIIWGPGPETQAAVFLLHAESAQPGSFDVFIDRNCDLLFAARVRLEVTEEPGSWTSSTPIAWDDATAEKVSGTKRSVAFRRFSALMQRQPGERAMCIAITRGTGSDEYMLTVLCGQAELPMRVKFSRAELDGLLMQVRGRLDRQRREAVLVDGGYDATAMYVGNYGPDADCRRPNGTAVPTLLIEESWNSFLSDMAIHGRALRDKLFADGASQEVLKAIRNATRLGSVLQVWTRDEAKAFLLPWAWIYDGDYRPETRDRPQP
jgi:hypothetical protein